MKHIVQSGFTLIEVLIAMMIIAISFTAILKATDQTTQQLIYLRQKIQAEWINVDLINQVQAGMITPSSEGLTGQAHMFNKIWNWNIALTNTLNKNIDEIHVSLSAQGNTLGSLTASQSSDITRIKGDA